MQKVYLVEESELKDKLGQYISNTIEKLVSDSSISCELSKKLYEAFDLKDEANRLESLSTTIDKFDLSVRARKALERLGVVNVKDLTQHTEAQVYVLKNCGKVTMSEIKKKILQPYGLTFKENQGKLF